MVKNAFLVYLNSEDFFCLILEMQNFTSVFAIQELNGFSEIKQWRDY